MAFQPPALLPHQRLVQDFLIHHPFAGIYLTMGGGKTNAVLSSLFTIRPQGHILVIAPINIARSTWTDEIKKWGYPLRYRSLIVNDNDKKLTKAKRLERYQEILSAPPTMYFINQDLIHDLVDSMPVVRHQGKNLIEWPFPTVIIDESQGFKNSSSRRFKALKKVRPAITRMIQLSGTPAPQGMLDMWGQINLLDQGQALGTRLGADYREKYFHPTAHIDGRPVAWAINHGAKEEIYRKISHLVMSTENANIPMPPVSIDSVNVTLPVNVFQAYKAFQRDLVLELATKDPNDKRTFVISADNAAILRGKLLQYASGTIYTGDNHDTDYGVLHDEKIQMTDYLLRQANSPTLVAYRYRSDKAELVTQLTKLGHQVEVFDGSNTMLTRWNKGLIPVMLLQPASAGHGLNLQDGGHTLIWYTLPDSLEHYLQTNARLARMGQQHPVQIWQLVSKGTFDEHMPTLLSRKSLTQADFLDAVRLDSVEFMDDIEDVIGGLDINPL